MEEFVAMEGIDVLDEAKARLESTNLPSRSPYPSKQTPLHSILAFMSFIIAFM
jgi:hypothetical protein